MFDLTTMGTVLYIAFVAYDEHDLLAVAWQSTALSVPRLRYRIRTYVEGSTPWDDQDPKTWYDAELRQDVTGDVCQLTQRWIAQVREGWEEPTRLVDEFTGPASPEDAVAWLRTRPWAHGREVAPGTPEYAQWLQAARRERRAERRRRRPR